MKKFLIICHNDLDGGVSAICIINYLNQKYGKDVKYQLAFKTYKNINQYVERIFDNPGRYEQIFIADISIDLYLAEDMPRNVLIIDHHDTAVHLKNFPRCIIDISGNHCGASLCYHHLLKNNKLKYKHLTSLVAIARDYDLWIHKLPKKIAKNVNFIYYKYWGEKFSKRFVDGFNGFNDDEKLFIQNKWDDIKQQLKDAKFQDLLEDEDEKYHNKLALYIDETKGDVNEICEYALNKMGFKIIVCVVPKKCQLSIRADEKTVENGCHIGRICEEIRDMGFASNGGGHPAAGGAKYETKNNLGDFLDIFADKISDFIV